MRKCLPSFLMSPELRSHNKEMQRIGKSLPVVIINAFYFFPLIYKLWTNTSLDLQLPSSNSSSPPCFPALYPLCLTSPGGLVDCPASLTSAAF